jgi:hypothetical protein
MRSYEDFQVDRIWRHWVVGDDIWIPTRQFDLNPRPERLALGEESRDQLGLSHVPLARVREAERRRFRRAGMREADPAFRIALRRGRRRRFSRRFFLGHDLLFAAERGDDNRAGDAGRSEKRDACKGPKGFDQSTNPSRSTSYGCDSATYQLPPASEAKKATASALPSPVTSPINRLSEVKPCPHVQRIRSLKAVPAALASATDQCAPAHIKKVTASALPSPVASASSSEFISKDVEA